MTAETPREFLSRVFQPRPPKRVTEDDSLIVDIRDLIARAQNKPHLHVQLVTLLRDALAETKIEHTAREYPGMIGVLHPEIA